MNINLAEVSKVLSSLKEPSQEKNLNGLQSAIDKFHAAIGPNLNKAELRYVMQTLINDQVVTVNQDSPLIKVPPVTVAHGFTVRAVI